MPPSASARPAGASVPASAAISIVLRFIMTASPEMIRGGCYSAGASGPLNTALSDVATRGLIQANDEVGAFAGLALVDALVGDDDRAARCQHLVDLRHGVGGD